MSTISTYTGDGTTKQFDITFSYDDQNTVKVKVDGSEVTYTFINPSRIETTTAPANGSEVRLFRKTSVSVPKVDFEDGAIVRADDLDAAITQPLHRTEELESELSDLTVRSLRAPAGESFGLFPSAADRASTAFTFDSNGDLVFRALAEVGLRPGVADVDYLAPGDGAVTRTFADKRNEFAVSPEDYGAIGDDTADDTAAFSAALTLLQIVGGGILRLTANKTYRVTAQITVTERIRVDFNGSKVRAELSGPNEAGLVLHSYTTVENGHLEVDSLGSPGTSAGAHAAIRLGALPSDAGTVAAPATGENPTSWIIRNMTLESDKLLNNVGAPGIQIYGGAHTGWIENITVPDHANMAAAVMMDWSFLGPIYSSGAARTAALGNDPDTSAPYTDLKNMDLNKASFNAGDAYTTHPHNIFVRNITVGALSRPATGSVDVGSWAVRLSGVYNVHVENVQAQSTTYRSFYHTAGDLGFEFAPAEIKPLACKNVVLRDCSVAAATSGYLAHSDSLADNVQVAVDAGYTPLMDPYHETNIVMERVVGTGPGSGADYGIRVMQQRGGTIRDCDVSYFKQGLNVDEHVYGLTIERFHGHFNREAGILIDHGVNKPVDVSVIDPHLHDNGTDTVGYPVGVGLYIGGSERVTVEKGRFGKAGAYDPTQQVGIRVMAGAIDTVIRDPHLRSARSADGYGIAVLGSTSYNEFGLLSNPRYETAYLTNTYTGLDTLPVSRGTYPGGGGQMNTDYMTNTANTLVGLTVVQGDRIWFGDVVAGGAPGRIAVSSGTIDGTNLDTLTKTMAAIAA